MNSEIIYKYLPNNLQNLLIVIYNLLAYRKRYGGNYKQYRLLYKQNRNLDLKSLNNIQDKKLEEFLNYCITTSPYYKNLKIKQVRNLYEFPIIDKEILRNNINDFITVNRKDAIISKTGGTTGKSLEVYFTPDDMQNRFAFLDDFRSRFGYELGKKTAWFSGKNLLTSRDTKQKRFWKYDFYHKVRYYSTFHIKEDFMQYYIADLKKYEPEFIVGFPSSLKELAEYGLRHGIDFPECIKAIFPTAETIDDSMRNTIEPFFKAPMYDQYASSEGAPFIIECIEGNLHLELQSGIFEVLDESNHPSNSGRLIVTSFTTHGTPLIRYDIGDRIKLSQNKICSCGNQNPIVEAILGREDDYLWSIDNGKMNLGNISNTLKGVKGLIQFQAIQDQLESISIFYKVDEKEFKKKDFLTFKKNWIDRIGSNTHLEFIKTDYIEKEKSGKYRLVKNNIKHLL